MRIEGKWKIGGIGAHRGDIEIPLAELGDAPLVAIVGDNGRGKTTMIETAPGGFYLDTPSRGPLSRLANRRDSFVDMGLGIGDQHFETKVMINGTAKQPKTEAYLTQNGEVVSSGKVGDYKNAIGKLLPAKETYLASGFAAQGGGGQFLRISKADRKALFIEMMGAGKLTEIQSAAGDKAKVVGADIAAKKVALDSLRDLLGDPDTLVAASKAADRDLEAAATELKGVEEHAKAIEAELEKWREKEYRLLEQVSKAELDKAAAAAKLEAGEEKLSQILSQINSKTSERDTEAEALSAKEELEAEAKKLSGAERRLKEIEEELEAARKAEAEYNAALPIWQKKRHEAETRYKEAKGRWDTDRTIVAAELKSAAKDLERLKQESGKLEEVPCGGSGEYAGCPLISLAVGAKARLEDAELQLEKVRARSQALSTEPAEVANTIAQGRTVGPEPVRPDPGQGASLEIARKVAQGDFSAASEARVRLESIAGAEKRVGTLDTAIAELKKERDAAGAVVNQLRVATKGESARCADLAAGIAHHRATKPAAFDETELDEARLSYTRATKAAEEAFGRLSAYEMAKNKVELLEDEIAELTRHQDDWLELKRAFGPDGIQALEIDAAGPEVSELVNTLLHECYGPRFSCSLETTTLTADGKKMKEVFDLRVIDSEQGTDGSAGDLSGGEKVFVGEALGLSIAIYNARRSSIPIEDIFRDEVAGALSSKNATRYVAMLRRALELGGFHRIWFIAHQPHLWPLADARLYFDGHGCRVVDIVPVAED